MIEWDIRVEACGGPGQDRAAILQLGQAQVVVVADGAGGSAGGAEAADAVVRLVERCGVSLRQARDPRHWCGVLGELDAALEADPSAGETTAVLVAILFGALVGASVGDSGALLFGDGAFTDLTARQQRKPLLGSGRAQPVGFGPQPFAGTLVVASDGLLRHADASRIWSCVAHTTLAEAASVLAGLPRMPSGELPDDVAVIVARPR